VIVGRGDDRDLVGVGKVGEPLDRWYDLLAAGNVELSVRLHEVVEGIDIPKNQLGHVVPKA
jgi:hypothetical protein